MLGGLAVQILRGSWDDLDQTHGVRRDRWTKWFLNSSKLRWIFQPGHTKTHNCELLLANHLGGGIPYFYLWMDGTMATKME